MLILTRRVGETIMVGDEVNMTILGVRGTQVRIGIDAPKDVAVHREEVYRRIQQERSMTEYLQLEQGYPSFHELENITVHRNGVQQGFLHRKLTHKHL